MSTPTRRSPFADRVLDVVSRTGPGEVLTYGEVAVEAGRPGAARAVGRALARYGSAVPWWRVVSASGRPAPGKESAQLAALRAEGVACDGGRVGRHSQR